MNSIATQGMTFEDALAVLAECQDEYNALAKIVSTKDPDSLRYACDEEMRLRYEAQGVKSLDVKIAGQTVATYSVVKTKEEPERTSERLDIAEGHAVRWVMEDADQGWLEKWLQEHAREIALDYMAETGELIPCAQKVVETVPAKPSAYKNTVLRVDPQKLVKAIAERDSIMLEEGNERVQ